MRTAKIQSLAHTNSSRLVVNMSELAEVLKISARRLQHVLASNPDHPVISRGGRGVDYLFDLEETVAWWQGLKAVTEEKRRARAAQRTLWAEELYGPVPVARGGRRLSAKERRALAEAERLEELNRRTRATLVERDELEATLDRAMQMLRNSFAKLPADLVRNQVLPSDLAHEFEGRLGNCLDACAAELAEALRKSA